MKSRTVVFVFFLLCCNASFSQFSGGIKAGGNYTNVIGTNSKYNKFKPGFHAGGFIEYEVADNFSLQAEVVYSQKGFRNKYSTPTTAGTITVTQDYNVLYTHAYLDVPFLLNIHFGQMGSYLGLGPQLSFLLSSKWDGQSTITTTDNSQTPPITTNKSFNYAGNNKTGYSKVDFGAVLGTGAKWDSGIEYCLRAGYGLTNMINPSEKIILNTTWNDNVWHNLVFSVSLGYAFGRSVGGTYVSGGHHYKKRRH